MTKIVASLKDRITINDFLKGKIEKGADGLVTYKDGFSDQAVVDALQGKTDGKITLQNVAGVRKEMYGDLRRGGSIPIEPLRQQVVQLTQIVHALQTDFKTAVAKITSLENQINVIKLADKHHRR